MKNKIVPCRTTHAGSSTCHGCRSDFDFEKQRFMTDDELKKEVEMGVVRKLVLGLRRAHENKACESFGCEACWLCGLIEEGDNEIKKNRR